MDDFDITKWLTEENVNSALRKLKQHCNGRNIFGLYPVDYIAQIASLGDFREIDSFFEEEIEKNRNHDGFVVQIHIDNDQFVTTCRVVEDGNKIVKLYDSKYTDDIPDMVKKQVDFIYGESIEIERVQTCFQENENDCGCYEFISLIKEKLLRLGEYG